MSSWCSPTLLIQLLLHFLLICESLLFLSPTVQHFSLLFFLSFPTSFHFLCFSLISQEFSTGGSSNTDTGKAAGNLEVKYKVKDLGLSLNQKWSTDNVLTTEVTLEDQVSLARRF